MPRVAGRLVAGVGMQDHLDLQRGSLVRDVDVEPQVAQHPHHRAVLGQHERQEPVDPQAPGMHGELLQQERRHPLVPGPRLDEGGDLRGAPAQRQQLHRTDQAAADARAQRQVAARGIERPIEVGPEVGGMQRREAEVPVVLGQPLVQAQELVGVRGLQALEHGDRPVAQQRPGGWTGRQTGGWVEARAWEDAVPVRRRRCRRPRARGCSCRPLAASLRTGRRRRPRAHGRHRDGASAAAGQGRKA